MLIILFNYISLVSLLILAKATKNKKVNTIIAILVIMHFIEKIYSFHIISLVTTPNNKDQIIKASMNISL